MIDIDTQVTINETTYYICARRYTVAKGPYHFSVFPVGGTIAEPLYASPARYATIEKAHAAGTRWLQRNTTN